MPINKRENNKISKIINARTPWIFVRNNEIINAIRKMIPPIIILLFRSLRLMIPVVIIAKETMIAGKRRRCHPCSTLPLDIVEKVNAIALYTESPISKIKFLGP